MPTTPKNTSPKPRLSEVERARQALANAQARTDKSAEKVAALQGKLTTAQAAWEADKRTSDYLALHPALAKGDAPLAPTPVFTQPEATEPPDAAEGDDADWLAAAPSSPVDLSDPFA